MKTKHFFIRDLDGYYLHLCPELGGYYVHKLCLDGALYFDSYLLALTFCNGYNSISGLDDNSKVRPSLETL